MMPSRLCELRVLEKAPSYLAHIKNVNLLSFQALSVNSVNLYQIFLNGRSGLKALETLGDLALFVCQLIRDLL